MEEQKKYRYKNSPLLEVIFQLRFPTILSINTNLPEKFQEAIREEYPFFEEGIEQQAELVMSENGISSNLNKQNKNYMFSSDDRLFRVNLTPSFISFSTNEYNCWEDFSDRIQMIEKIFRQIYKPAFYVRIGLRYENAITKSKIGFENEKWSNLISPHVLGFITPEIENDTQSFVSITEFKNEDGTSTRAHFELVHVNNQQELSFLIDCDNFVLTKTELSDMLAVAEKLHNNSSNFIRQAITDKLHNGLEPEPIDS